MDKNVNPSASTGETKVSHHKMEGDHCRYLAERSTDDAKSLAAEDTRVECAEATKVTGKIESSPIPRRWHSECQYDGRTKCSRDASYGNGKVRLHEIFAEMVDPTSLRQVCERYRAFHQHAAAQGRQSRSGDLIAERECETAHLEF